MVYGPIAAFLVEFFPARIRYTSLSIPYHIGNGWFGGFLPLISAAIIAATGNLIAALIYPITVAIITVIVGGLFIRESRHVKIWDEVEMRPGRWVTSCRRRAHAPDVDHHAALASTAGGAVLPPRSSVSPGSLPAEAHHGRPRPRHLASAATTSFYRRSLDDPEAFWLEAAEAIDWSQPPTRAFEQPSPPTFRGSRAAGRTWRSTRSTATSRRAAAAARR